MTELKFIRNFAIIAHIDHGKSTLADRLIQLCGGLTKRELREQVLDTMELERERGITIKAHSVLLNYQADDGNVYELNLMDTPGHVDFAYEVSRSLAACEGSLLIVDASQGVEAQTLANVYQAIENDHEIVPMLNKIDLVAAEPERVKGQLKDVIGLDPEGALLASAKTGEGVKEVLEALIHRLPAPKGEFKAPLRALLVDSWYDAYLGVVILVRILDGELKRGQKIRMMATDASYTIDRVGVYTPKQETVEALGPGEIGFFTASIKAVADCRIGDTITDAENPALTSLPGFKPSVPVVFCGLFPMDAADFGQLRESLGKLGLNDASFVYEAETSVALGFGFRCGFLGLLHMEIITERLEREFNLDLITTAPFRHLPRSSQRWRSEGASQPGRSAGPGEDHQDRGALDQDDDLGSRRLSWRSPAIVYGTTRRAGRAHLRRQPRDGRLSAALERDRLRLLRPAEERLARLCEFRLRDGRLQGRGAREADHPREW